MKIRFPVALDERGAYAVGCQTGGMPWHGKPDEPNDERRSLGLLPSGAKHYMVRWVEVEVAPFDAAEAMYPVGRVAEPVKDDKP